MGKQIARHNDIGVGICYGHDPPIPQTGNIVASATICTCDGLPLALEGDIMLGLCGHTGVLVGSSSVVESEGKKIIRVGDSFTGTFVGVVTTGSGKTSSE